MSFPFVGRPLTTQLSCTTCKYKINKHVGGVNVFNKGNVESRSRSSDIGFKSVGKTLVQM